ncbi:MAG: hypothetical protein M1598_01750 [Actinobacteria bacterium]|nr:hypothetical protein [Actinomycetota bacterium]
MKPWVHAYWNYFLFHRSRSVWLVVAGSVAPDVSSMIAFLWIGFTRGRWGWESVWQAWSIPWVYFSGFFTHSAVIWGAFALASHYLWKRAWPFAIGWGVHLLEDGLTHVTDAYPFFWPFSWRLFPSSISYWETSHHSREYAIWNSVAVALSLIYLGYSWYRRRKLRGS